jgi:hypothetical protein
VVLGEGALSYERSTPVLCVGGERIPDSSRRPQKAGGLVVVFGLDRSLDRVGESRRSRIKLFLRLSQVYAILDMGVMTKKCFLPIR